MKSFSMEFKDDNEKVIVNGMILLAIVLSFISPLLVFFLFRDKISEKSYEFTKALLNFESLLFIICIIFCIISFIPLIGWLIGAFLGWLFSAVIIIYNAVMMLLNIFKISDRKEAQLPVPYEFV